MNILAIAVWILIGITAAVLLIAFVCFYMAFYSPTRKPSGDDNFDIPPGEIYEPFREQMVTWMKETRALPHDEITIRSFDGLTLYGQYYECCPDAPVELMFHGYRGTAERDLCGGVQRCFALGRNVLIVDQRASSKSDGHVITFGIRESRDCLSWIDYLIERFGKDVKIILTGISMGASTVLIAAGRELPPNVVGVLADCGFTDAKEIICHVIREMKLPPKLAYPFVRLGARLYGRFDPEETSAIEAVRSCRVPVIFIHGEADAYVPCEMSRRNYEACASPKTLLTVPGAGHGLAYLINRDAYFRTLTEFCNQHGLLTSVTVEL